MCKLTCLGLLVGLLAAVGAAQFDPPGGPTLDLYLQGRVAPDATLKAIIWRGTPRDLAYLAVGLKLGQTPLAGSFALDLVAGEYFYMGKVDANGKETVYIHFPRSLPRFLAGLRLYFQAFTVGLRYPRQGPPVPKVVLRKSDLATTVIQGTAR